MKKDTAEPTNVASLDLTEARAANGGQVRWAGAYASCGGVGSSQSATVYFTIAPGDRLGRHTNSTEETQPSSGGAGSYASTMAYALWRPGTLSGSPKARRTTWSTWGRRCCEWSASSPLRR